ncbi:MAG: hypothetical protein QF733_06795 [Phycisphaerales bacterium]|jgi:hypothetical protein|nr:hypothetical protein [Phycisphaerales bacterium]
MSHLDLATTWFLAARAMACGGDEPSIAEEAAAGLFARAILGLDEASCIAAKSAEHMQALTLIDCMSMAGRLPRGTADQVMAGVMMIAYAAASMQPLQVRWASMLASSMDMTEERFQRCCVNARVIASMLPHEQEAVGG